MTGKRVSYNGLEMAAEWPARIEEAQLVGDYHIGGIAYPRIRYGSEEGGLFQSHVMTAVLFAGNSMWSLFATWKNALL